MNNSTVYFPVLLAIYEILKENEEQINSYLSAPARYIGIKDPIAFLSTLVLLPLAGVKRLYHYQTQYQGIYSSLNSIIAILTPSKLKTSLYKLSSSMLSWKILLFQAFLIKKYPQLLKSKSIRGRSYNFLDMDGISFVSFSRKREGSQNGHNRKYRGKPTLQGSASMIGSVFVDFKLFSGSTNVSTCFKKMVKRVLSMGYYIDIVRCDAAYGLSKNLLFLEKLSLHYIMGIRTSIYSIKQEVVEFKKLARLKSSKILHISKGLAIMDLGLVNVASKKEKAVFRRVILCRNTQRKKKAGKWKVKTYYYGIVTDLDWTPKQIFKTYHQRQVIENGFKELNYHYGFNKIQTHKLRLNEFWMVSKILSLTLVKLFAIRHLGNRFAKMRLKTILRRFLSQTISSVHKGKVHLLPRPKYLWHLKRIIVKLENGHIGNYPLKIVL